MPSLAATLITPGRTNAHRTPTHPGLAPLNISLVVAVLPFFFRPELRASQLSDGRSAVPSAAACKAPPGRHLPPAPAPLLSTTIEFSRKPRDKDHPESRVAAVGSQHLSPLSRAWHHTAL
eukprot:scaffold33083_cov129-Isochrysis_galbana.AAC.5